MTDKTTTLDLFAGTGWGVACQRLGILELGVDNMAAVKAVRNANGMPTIYADVWDGLQTKPLDYNLLIASPPCQTFSLAGNGSGRKALDDVIGSINAGVYKNPETLQEHGRKYDDRTALVLTPLAHIYRDHPEYVALEQVPAILPVWEAYARIMQGSGYSVWTGILSAEQYGVPQARKRAVLIARRDGLTAMPPRPTHSKYYRTNPQQTDPKTLPWVSMADALGWGRTNAPAPTYCNSGNGGAGIEWGGNSIRIKMREQSLTLDNWKPKQGAEPGTNDAIRVTVAEAAKLQTYPENFIWDCVKTKAYIQIGNAVPPLLSQRILEAVLN